MTWHTKLGWNVRRVLFRHAFVLAALWMVVVIAATHYFVRTVPCGESMTDAYGAFSSLRRMLPDYSTSE